MKRASLHNLGCRVNEYETEAMRQMMAAAGYEIVPFDEPADVCVVNTCTVTAVADKKSRQMLHRAKQLNPDAVVVACGCYVQDRADELLSDGAVDLVIGNSDKENLAEILARYLEDAEPCAKYVEDVSSVREYGHLRVGRSDVRTRAFVKIQDGCNQFCTYCRIPYVRGRARSRAEEEILDEVRGLTEAGCREIVLSGIHISSYGLDFETEGNRQTPSAAEEVTNERLIGLIRSVQRIPEIGRIRLGSLEPGILTRDFVQQLAAFPDLCPQFHISLQSGSDAVLARMNRKYTTADFRKGVNLLRRYFTDPAITTDLIVGFPGETAGEFTETLRFAEQIGFAKIHIFKYSRREGTKAAEMPDQVGEELKQARSRALSSLEKQMRLAYLRRIAPYPADVLFETCAEEARPADGQEGSAVPCAPLWAGHTSEGAPALCRSFRNLVNVRMTFPSAEVDEEGNLRYEPEEETGEPRTIRL